MKQEKNKEMSAAVRVVLVIAGFIIAGIAQGNVAYAGGGGSYVHILSTAPDFVVSVQSGACFGDTAYALQFGDIAVTGVDQYEVPLSMTFATSTEDNGSFPCGNASSSIVQSFTLAQPVSEKVTMRIIPAMVSCGAQPQTECDSFKDSMSADQTFFAKPLIGIQTTAQEKTMKAGVPFSLTTFIVADAWGKWLDAPVQTSSTVYAVNDDTHATTTLIVGDTGEALLKLNDTGTYTLIAQKEGYESLVEKFPYTITIEALPAVVNMHVRYQDAFLFNDSVTVPSDTYLSDSNGATHFMAVAPNVLIALKEAADSSRNFAITKLDYYDSFGSFYLDCITIETSTSTRACGNWNYVVDGVYPSASMDSYPLKGGEQVYVYFGTPWNITASTSTFSVGATTTLSTWRYNYNSTSTEWTADGGDIIDISVLNPASTGWWDTTMTTTTLLSSADGAVDYVLSSTGTYYAKITSSDFSKWSNPVTLNVIDAPVATTSAATSTPSGGGEAGGGGNGGAAGSKEQVSSASIEDTVKKILDFFVSRQGADGHVVDAGTTDWVIMSFGAHNSYASDIAHTSSSLLQFIQSDATLDNEANMCTAHARRVLALRAAGIPADDARVAPRAAFLIAHCGAAGDKNLPEINDDIFVALALNALGVERESAIIKGLRDAILAAQDAQTGAFIAWGSPAPDMTGAAINALKAIGSASVLDNAAIARAKQYLHSTQLTDGGWNAWGASSDYITTAWVMMGINALGEGQSEWVSASGKTPWHVMTEKLNVKGYYDSPWDAEGIDWFGAKHAVPALLGKSWPITLAPKPQPSAQTNQSASLGGGSNTNVGSGNTESNNGSFAAASSTLAAPSLPLPVFTTSTSETSVQASSTPVLSNITEFDIMNRAQNEAQASSVTAIPARRRRVKEDGIQGQRAAIQSNQSGQLQESLFVRAKTQPDPLLPLKKNIAQSTTAGSAAVFAGTSVLLLLRLLLAAL